MAQWRSIIGFPGYSVSDEGQVRNDKTGELLKPSPNQRGIATVGMMQDGHHRKRSLSVLVADAFVTHARSLEFDTPVHRDGDKFNCHADNLVWRPRWYALEYVRQFSIGPKGFACKVEEMKSGEVFANSWDASINYGILEREIVFSIMRQTYVIPTYQRFRLHE